MPNSQGGSADGSVVALHAPDDLAGAYEAHAVGVDRVDVWLGDVVCPNLDVVELSEVRREERADGTAADDTDSHEYDASFPLTSA